MRGSRALDSSGRPYTPPVTNKQIAMNGNVHSSKVLRPKVSMVYQAGIAKTKVMAAKPQDASRAC